MVSKVAIADRNQIWLERLKKYRARLPSSVNIVVEGKLSRMVGLTLEAVGCRSAIGGRCIVEVPDGHRVEAEVVGFSGERLYLMVISVVWSRIAG